LQFADLHSASGRFQQFHLRPFAEVKTLSRSLQMLSVSSCACQPAEVVRIIQESLIRAFLPSHFSLSLNILSLTKLTGITCNKKSTFIPCYFNHLIKNSIPLFFDKVLDTE
jgi:hypothetical protein